MCVRVCVCLANLWYAYLRLNLFMEFGGMLMVGIGGLSFVWYSANSFGISPRDKGKQA